MHIDRKRIGDMIREARERDGFTQASLAEEIDVSLRTVAAIENGQRNPTLDVFSRLVHTLDIPTDLIFRPETVTHTLEQELFLSEAEGYNEWERRIVRNLVRDLRRDKSND